MSIDLVYKIIISQLDKAEKDMDKTGFDWNDVYLSHPDAPVNQIKNRLVNELYLSDKDVLRIMRVFTEELKKIEEMTA